MDRLRVQIESRVTGNLKENFEIERDATGLSQNLSLNSTQIPSSSLNTACTQGAPENLRKKLAGTRRKFTLERQNCFLVRFANTVPFIACVARTMCRLGTQLDDRK